MLLILHVPVIIHTHPHVPRVTVAELDELISFVVDSQKPLHAPNGEKRRMKLRQGCHPVEQDDISQRACLPSESLDHGHYRWGVLEDFLELALIQLEGTTLATLGWHDGELDALVADKLNKFLCRIIVQMVIEVPFDHIQLAFGVERHGPDIGNRELLNELKSFRKWASNCERGAQSALSLEFDKIVEVVKNRSWLLISKVFSLAIDVLVADGKNHVHVRIPPHLWHRKVCILAEVRPHIPVEVLGPFRVFGEGIDHALYPDHILDPVEIFAISLGFEVQDPGRKDDGSDTARI